jgi:predicted DNA-binding transcriptional regulator AlpA
MDRDDDPLLDTEKVKELLGVEKVETVHLYLKRTRARVKDGLAIRPQDMPLPDELFGGRAPAWRQSTITGWIARRPGRGRRGPEK